jgi:glycosyltransferase involved in cell wall biosynthesis
MCRKCTESPGRSDHTLEPRDLLPESGEGEAMAHEVAVLGTNVGATPEVIGDAGLVVPPDDPLALAAALRRLAAPDQRRPLAQAGRARAMRLFSDDAVAERTLEFWKELTG